jgi:hypothetical protein
MISKNRPSARTRYNNPTLPETCSRNPKISKAQIKRIDNFIQNQGFEARILTWKQLAEACKIEGPSEQTIQRAIGNSIYYSKYIACQKAWVLLSAIQNQLHFAINKMLCKYPTPEV